LSLLSFLSSNPFKKENKKYKKYYGIRARRAKSHAKALSREVLYIKKLSVFAPLREYLGRGVKKAALPTESGQGRLF